MSERLSKTEFEELNRFVRSYEDPNSPAWGNFRGNATEWEKMVALFGRALDELRERRAADSRK